LKTSIRKSSSSKSKKTASPPKKKAPPTRTASLDRAIADFDQAVKAFSKEDYTKAAQAFDAIIGEYPAEREICDRARVYGNICRVRSAGEGPKPKGAEDLYYHGVVAANDGRFDEAVAFLEQAAKVEPDNDKVYYQLSAVCGLKNDTAAAITHLARAIELNPSNRVYALNDADFDGLREDAQFMGLLGKEPEGAV